MNKGLFLDRDGVINFDYSYVYTKENFIFRDEIFEICEIAQKNQFKIIVVTNQAGIGRGYFSNYEFKFITRYMLDTFKKRNIHINKVFYCPFHPEYGVRFYKKRSFFRKPNPGMILHGLNQFSINAKYSLMIGDKVTDRLAAEKANINNFVNSNNIQWNIKAIKIINKIGKEFENSI